MHFIDGLKEKIKTESLLVLQLGEGGDEEGDRRWKREVAGSCTEPCCCTGNTLSALCKKELHLSFLRDLTAFQERFIQGQIGISVTAKHRGQEK